MNIQKLIQSGSAKAADLFSKLADTSNGAAKVREKFFGELKVELELLVDLEKKHLLPLLGKHEETKALVPVATKANEELRAKLRELDGMPKGEDAFVLKLADLQKGFQQHMRDGKKELLPAVQKVLGDEGAAEAAKAVEASRIEAEQAKRDEAEKAKRLEAEKAKRDEAERAQAKARQHEERAEREAAEREAAKEIRTVVARAAEREPAKDVARATSHRVVEGMGAGVRRSASSLETTADQSLTMGVRAVATSSRATASAMAEMQAEGQAWLSRAVTDGMQVSAELMRCTSPVQVARVQRDFLSAAMRNWMESGSRVLQISRRAMGQRPQ